MIFNVVSVNGLVNITIYTTLLILIYNSWSHAFKCYANWFNHELPLLIIFAINDNVVGFNTLWTLELALTFIFYLIPNNVS